MAGARVAVCSTDDVTAGQPRVVKVHNLSIGIFNVNGNYYALLNVCPHRGAALCEGIQCGTTMPTDDYNFVYGRENSIIRCAWHGWEFDIQSGGCLAAPQVKAKTFTTSVEDGQVFVHL